jgi:hypothetical protein
MTAHRDLKKIIRDRQEKTGESYATVLQELLQYRVDRDVELGARLRRLLCPALTVPRCRERQPPERTRRPIQILLPRVRRLTRPRPAEEPERVQDAAVFRDPGISREAHNVLEREPRAPPPPRLLVLDPSPDKIEARRNT